MASSRRRTRSISSGTPTPSRRASASSCIDALAQAVQALLLGARLGPVGDVGAGGPAIGQHAGRRQFAIGTGHGVGIDDELLGEHPDRRQLLARRQPSRRHQGLDLLDDLLIDRHTVGRADT